MISPYPFKRVFPHNGNFAALAAAHHWLFEHGYSYAPTCRSLPVGIKRGTAVIAKWRNLLPAEIKQLDGIIEGDMRNGPLIVRLKCDPAEYENGELV